MKGPKFARLLLFAPSRLAEADVAYIDASRARNGESPFTEAYRPEHLRERERMAREARSKFAGALLLVAGLAAAGAGLGVLVRLGPTASAVCLGVSACLAVLATLGAVENVTIDGACPIDHAVRWLYRATYGASVALAAWGTVSQAFPPT